MTRVLTTVVKVQGIGSTRLGWVSGGRERGREGGGGGRAASTGPRSHHLAFTREQLGAKFVTRIHSFMDLNAMMARGWRMDWRARMDDVGG
jgi:hypothetical protein